MGFCWGVLLGSCWSWQKYSELWCQPCIVDSSLHHFLTGSRPRSRFLPLRADGTQTIWLLPLSLKPHISAAHKSFPKVGKDQFARQKRNQTSKPKSMRNSSPHCFVLRSVTVVVGCLAISAIYSRSESIQKVKSWERNKLASLGATLVRNYDSLT